FDYASDAHEVFRAPENAGERVPEINGPIHQLVEELVRAGDNGRHDESPMQNLIGLVSRVVGCCNCEVARLSRCCITSHIMSPIRKTNATNAKPKDGEKSVNARG